MSFLEKLAIWEKVKKALQYKYNLAIGDMFCFTDFFGEVMNDNNEPFEVMGSIEYDDETHTLSYSIVFYDVNNQKEYDGIIGKFHGITFKTDIESLVDKIVLPNFVELC